MNCIGSDQKSFLIVEFDNDLIIISCIPTTIVDTAILMLLVAKYHPIYRVLYRSLDIAFVSIHIITVESDDMFKPLLFGTNDVPSSGINSLKQSNHWLFPHGVNADQFAPPELVLPRISS